MSNRLFVFALTLLAVSVAIGQACAADLISYLPAEGLSRFVAAELDLATVQSSLNPRRGVHQIRFADLGPAVTEASEDRVVLDGPYEIFVIQV